MIIIISAIIISLNLEALNDPFDEDKLTNHKLKTKNNPNRRKFDNH